MLRMMCFRLLRSMHLSKEMLFTASLISNCWNVGLFVRAAILPEYFYLRTFEMKKIWFQLNEHNQKNSNIGKALRG